MQIHKIILLYEVEIIHSAIKLTWRYFQRMCVNSGDQHFYLNKEIISHNNLKYTYTLKSILPSALPSIEHFVPYSPDLNFAMHPKPHKSFVSIDYL